ncbi:Zn-ribbon domain-containing OB-fold protein [Nocardia sp. IBHARD005]|uniref:Zn-ribbon domain-containing OB-fold protein n=1 Tax=Nocardia sp. IBHARD005 TaxID=3457765 RepID=UPI0040582D79
MEDILMIRRCTCCSTLFAAVTLGCSSCASGSLEWLPSSGAGSIVSWRVVDRDATGMRGARPLTIAIVELDEGPWVYTSIEGELPPRNCPVRVQFQPCSRDDRFPVFAVSAGPRTSGDQRRAAYRISV